jgi:hypothetical protein
MDGAVNSGGTIEVSAAAALVGSYGLSITPRCTTSSNYENITFVYQGLLAPVKRFRQRFYFDVNSCAIAVWGRLRIARDYIFTPVYRIDIYIETGGNLRFNPYTYNDADTELSAGYFAFSDAPHYFELDWKASSAPGADDGFLDVWIDGVHQGAGNPTLSGVDNDTKRLSRPCLGCVYGHSSTTITSSTPIYFDNWEGNDDGTEIGE